MNGKLIFITGGIRSGKSAFAEKTTAKLGDKVIYLATASAVSDPEMQKRIELHRKRRPQNWFTVEEEIRICDVLKKYGSDYDVILLDCITMLISNLMLKNDVLFKAQKYDAFQEKIINEITNIAEIAKEISAHVVVVSNEVGMTLVDVNALGRQYQELVGKTNQIFAAKADEAYLVVDGYSIDLKNGRNI